ncbi:hypothetical protein FF38_09917 [Lucilia cuprina]|uniref:Uncharacterized protein n=1 Tax=Lucilia cuprina TaxID=7375 RepID=A0A0L0CD39_LUCCU|nr:hypothetical protein FF38_09917 [Lucilia cuprina]
MISIQSIVIKEIQHEEFSFERIHSETTTVLGVHEFISFPLRIGDLIRFVLRGEFNTIGKIIVNSLEHCLVSPTSR